MPSAPDKTRADYVRALPTLSEAAELIDISPAGITRAIGELGIEPLAWGRRDKHLAVADLLPLAVHLQRASVEEVAGGLLEDVERKHPEHLQPIGQQVERFFQSLPARRPSGPDGFLAELRAVLPREYAEQAEAIYRRHALTS